jgi:tRNA A37 methylthiotransferase MiaB
MRVEVLVEGMHKESQQLTGRTRTNTIVNFAGPECLMGQRCEIEVVRGCKNSLVGCYHESFPKNG